MNTETLNANIEKIPSLEEVREQITKAAKELGDDVATNNKVFDEKGLAILSMRSVNQEEGEGYRVYQYMRRGYKHPGMDDESSGEILVIIYDENGKIIDPEPANQKN